jgi:predicted transposase YdaD
LKQGLQQGRDEGKKEGHKEGAQQKALAIASKLRALGLSEDVIQAATGLSPRELLELNAELT